MLELPPVRDATRIEDDGPQRVADRKAALRRQGLAVRASIPPDAHAAIAAALAERLLDLPQVHGARRVLGYAAFGDEVSLDPTLLRLLDRGVTVLLPFLVRGAADLGIAPVADLRDDVIVGTWGIREPARRPGRPLPRNGEVTRVAPPQVILVPGVAFDRAGGRLGMGRGYYDRLLVDLAGVPTIGVTCEALLVEEVPREAHDVRLDAVATEAALYRGGPIAPPENART